MKFEEMSDLEISARVLHAKKIPHKIEHGTCFIDHGFDGGECVYVAFDPCNKPNDAWPIIVESRIAVIPTTDNKWMSYGWRKWSGKVDYSPRKHFTHENPLRAAMICFLMMKEAENA